MPLKPVEPPAAVRSAAAAHVHQLATPHGIFPALRDVVRQELALVAPHRVYTLGLDAVLEKGLEGAASAGWRYQVTDRDQIVASAVLAGDAGESPLLNSGPFVSSTVTAIDDLESRPEIAQGEFELRLLKVPGLYVVAAWLVGERRLIAPLAPTPSFLEAGRLYTEEDFVAALQEPARRVLAAEGASGG
jgi:hypothetical protein